MKVTIVNNQGKVITHEVTSVVFTPITICLVYKTPDTIRTHAIDVDRATEGRYSLSGIASMVIEE